MTLTRSVLYLPASNARAIDKARGLNADAVILDLEDAVAPDAKPAARHAAVAALTNGGFGPRVGVRINGLDTPWGADDLAALSGLKPDFVVAPNDKVAGRVASTPEHWQRQASMGRDAHAMAGGARLEDIFEQIKRGEIATLNLVAGTAILCHEAFVFYAVAGFILLGSKDRGIVTCGSGIGIGIAVNKTGIKCSTAFNEYTAL